jgi:hypothetical protein
LTGVAVGRSQVIFGMKTQDALKNNRYVCFDTCVIRMDGALVKPLTVFFRLDFWSRYPKISRPCELLHQMLGTCESRLSQAFPVTVIPLEKWPIYPMSAITSEEAKSLQRLLAQSR